MYKDGQKSPFPFSPSQFIEFENKDQIPLYDPDDQLFSEIAKSPKMTILLDMIKIHKKHSDKNNTSLVYVSIIGFLLFLIGLFWVYKKNQSNHLKKEEQINPLKEKLIHLVSNDQLEKVFSLIDNNKVFFEKNFKTFQLLQLQYTSAKQNYNLNLITYDEMAREKAKVAKGILDLL